MLHMLRHWHIYKHTCIEPTENNKEKDQAHLRVKWYLTTFFSLKEMKTNHQNAFHYKQFMAMK